MQNELITSFAEYRAIVNEAMAATEISEGRSTNVDSAVAPLRTKVLGFIAEKGQVSKKELLEFFSLVEEELGQKPSWSWLRKNSHLIDSDLDENGETTYTLTKRGSRVLDVYKNYEKLSRGGSLDESEEVSKEEEIERAKQILAEAGIRTIETPEAE